MFLDENWIGGSVANGDEEMEQDIATTPGCGIASGDEGQLRITFVPFQPQSWVRTLNDTGNAM